MNSNNKKILRVLLFAIVFCILFFACEKLFFNKNEVNSVWGKLNNTDIDVLLMGNSHIYTSLDAKVLSDATGLEIDTLSSSAQNMEQTLENLKVVLKYQTPECIILEANSVYIDNKESMQSDGIGKMLQNTDGVDNYVYKLQSVVQTYKPKDLLTAMFQLARPVDTWTRWSNFSDRENYKEDANGYVGKDSMALVEKNMQELQDRYFKRYEKGQKASLPEYNIKAFQEFLQLTQDNGIEVWIYKGPTTRVSYAETMLAIEEVCRDYSHVAYIDDMHTRLVESGLNEADWYDTGHLNRAGAEKITRYYGELIGDRLGVTLDWTAPYTYYGERVEATEEGTYRYTMENYSDDCLYQFELRVNGKAQETQSFSDNNVFECAYDVRYSDEYDVVCVMIPKEDADLGNESESKIVTSFMKQNDCVIE